VCIHFPLSRNTTVRPTGVMALSMDVILSQAKDLCIVPR
jgi:hypothetical protein